MMGDLLLGAKVAPTYFKCGGWTECDDLHQFHKPEDVLVINEAVPLDDFRSDSHTWTQDKEDDLVQKGALYTTDKHIVPTLLGIWYEEASVN